jgi:hypothetical protein
LYGYWLVSTGSGDLPYLGESDLAIFCITITSRVGWLDCIITFEGRELGFDIRGRHFRSAIELLIVMNFLRKMSSPSREDSGHVRAYTRLARKYIPLVAAENVQITDVRNRPGLLLQSTCHHPILFEVYRRFSG